MADEKAVKADPVAAAKAFAARDEAAQVLADRTVARARAMRARTQAALAAVSDLPSGLESTEVDVSVGSDVAAPSCSGGRPGSPDAPGEEDASIADIDLIDFSEPEDQPLRGAGIVPVGDDRPLLDRISVPANWPLDRRTALVVSAPWLWYVFTIA